jgi:hypothetical protein
MYIPPLYCAMTSVLASIRCGRIIFVMVSVMNRARKSAPSIKGGRGDPVHWTIRIAGHGNLPRVQECERRRSTSRTCGSLTMRKHGHCVLGVHFLLFWKDCTAICTSLFRETRREVDFRCTSTRSPSNVEVKAPRRNPVKSWNNLVLQVPHPPSQLPHPSQTSTLCDVYVQFRLTPINRFTNPPPICSCSPCFPQLYLTLCQF